MVKKINKINIKKLANNIETFINNDPFIRSKFKHHKNKYNINEMLINIIIILKTGISYRNVSDYTHINWNTIYKLN